MPYSLYFLESGYKEGSSLEAISGKSRCSYFFWNIRGIDVW